MHNAVLTELNVPQYNPRKIVELPSATPDVQSVSTFPLTPSTNEVVFLHGQAPASDDGVYRWDGVMWDKLADDVATGNTANGTAVIPQGQTVVTVNHGVMLGTVEEIYSTNNHLATQSPVIENITPTSFDIRLMREPGPNTATYWWKVVG